MGELPEPWNTAAEQAGVRQTYRGIGDRAGISHVTIRRLIGQGRTSQGTVSKVAEALGQTQETIYKWAGIERSEWGPWIPPKEAHQLDPRAREALNELIRVMTTGGTNEDRPSDPKKMIPIDDQPVDVTPQPPERPRKPQAHGRRRPSAPPH